MAFPTMLSARLACLIGLLLFLRLPCHAGTATGDVTGLVLDKVTKAAIIGAQVSCSTRTAVTDRTGRYTLTGLATGNRLLAVAMSDYQPATVPVVIAARVQITAPNALLNSASTQSRGPNTTIAWNGGNWYLAGNNYAWWNYGTDFGTGGFGKYTNFTQINSDFATMHSQHVTTSRWFVFADGRYSPEFDGSGNVTGLDSQFFSDIDTALQIAHNNNVYLILNLADFLMWTGPRTSGTVSGGGHASMVTNAAVQQSYLENAVKPLLQHIAASPYKNNVLAYDIINEPEYTISEITGGGLPLAQVQTFVKNCATYIHQYSGGAYATLGSGTPQWVGYWKGLGLDFYQLHYYPNFDGNGPGSGLPPYASLNLDKPCIVGEFATNDNSYTLGDTTPLSAQWHLDTIFKYGYAGALGWSYNYHDYEGNWNAFVSVFSPWVNAHSTAVGPQ